MHGCPRGVCRSRAQCPDRPQLGIRRRSAGRGIPPRHERRGGRKKSRQIDETDDVAVSHGRGPVRARFEDHLASATASPSMFEKPDIVNPEHRSHRPAYSAKRWWPPCRHRGSRRLRGRSDRPMEALAARSPASNGSPKACSSANTRHQVRDCRPCPWRSRKPRGSMSKSGRRRFLGGVAGGIASEALNSEELVLDEIVQAIPAKERYREEEN